MTHSYSFTTSDMAHSYVYHDSRFIHVCDMTQSMYVTWLIYISVMTHSCVHCDAFMCVTWLMHMYNATCVTRLIHIFTTTRSIYVTWLIHISDMTRSYVNMTHSYICHDSWHDSFICVTWLICISDILIHAFTMTRSCVWHDSCICMSHATHINASHDICDMTHSYLYHESTWLIHIFTTNQHDSFISLPSILTWLIHIVLPRVTWLIH